jgi:hypothetical protein
MAQIRRIYYRRDATKEYFTAETTEAAEFGVSFD